MTVNRGFHVYFILLICLGIFVSACNDYPYNNGKAFVTYSGNDQPTFGAQGGTPPQQQPPLQPAPPKANCQKSSADASSSTYYVATDGNDSNSGTSVDCPFRSIQAAANIAHAGSTVYIRGGIYRESIVPAQSGSSSSSPIVFSNYNGESVTVSGADLVTGWSVEQGSIYHASLPNSWSDLGVGNNQVFMDEESSGPSGTMMVEARWPDIGLNISHPAKERMHSIRLSGNTATIDDPNLTEPTGFWNGATIQYLPGAEWVAYSAQISSYTHDSAGGHLTFNFYSTWAGEIPLGGGQLYGTTYYNPFYLFGVRGALRYPGQWYINPSTRQISFWAPGNANPAQHTVEVKSRRVAFELQSRKFITIQGLKIFASNIHTDGNSQGIVLLGLDVEYPSHFAVLPQGGWYTFSPNDQTNIVTSGVVLNGTNNLIQNSTVAYSAGSGVVLNGSGSTVDHCTIHDVDYAATDSAAVFALGYNHTISNNILYNSGRSLLSNRAASGLHIVHNIIHDAGFQVTDYGGTYAYDTDGGNTEIAYNFFYNIGGDQTHYAAAIYLDNGTRNFNIHHNLVWNSDNAVKLNPSGDQSSGNRYVHDNTLLANYNCIDAQTSSSIYPADTIQNDVFNTNFVQRSGFNYSGNAHASISAQINPPLNLNLSNSNPLGLATTPIP